MHTLKPIFTPKGGGDAAAPFGGKYLFEGVHWDTPSNYVLSRGSPQLEGVQWVPP